VHLLHDRYGDDRIRLLEQRRFILTGEASGFPVSSTGQCRTLNNEKPTSSAHHQKDRTPKLGHVPKVGAAEGTRAATLAVDRPRSVHASQRNADMSLREITISFLQ